MTDNIKLPSLPESNQTGDQTTDYFGHALKHTDKTLRDYAREAVRLNAAPVAELRRLISDDGLAMSFQTLGQYRSMLLKALAAAPEPQGVPQSENAVALTKDAVYEAIRLAEGLAASVGMNNRDSSANYSARLRDHLMQFVPPTAEPQGVPEPAEPTNKEKLLADALGKCILASGIVRQDIDGLSGPQLLMFAEDLREMLAAQPEQERNPLWHEFDHWYWKAVASSAPDHWMQAALVARRICTGIPRKEAGAEQERNAEDESDMLTIAYMAGYEKGKDAMTPPEQPK